MNHQAPCPGPLPARQPLHARSAPLVPPLLPTWALLRVASPSACPCLLAVSCLSAPPTPPSTHPTHPPPVFGPLSQIFLDYLRQKYSALYQL